jgi:hypothetical protein
MADRDRLMLMLVLGIVRRPDLRSRSQFLARPRRSRRAPSGASPQEVSAFFSKAPC